MTTTNSAGVDRPVLLADSCDLRQRSAPVVIRTKAGTWYTAYWSVYDDGDNDHNECWELIGREGLQIDADEVVEWFYPSNFGALVKAATDAEPWLSRKSLKYDENVAATTLRGVLQNIGRCLELNADWHMEIKPGASDEVILEHLDELLEMQAQLMFAKGKAPEPLGEFFGVALLDFMRLNGMRVREIIRAALAGNGKEGAK